MLQWHVTARALQQWTKYKAMIEADAAGKELHSDEACLQSESYQPTGKQTSAQSLAFCLLPVSVFKSSPEECSILCIP